jgi:hypothetical protein
VIRRLPMAWPLVLAGCFDSIVTDPCVRGYALEDGRCVAHAAPDAGLAPEAVPDAGVSPDAPDTPDASGGDGGGDADAGELTCPGADLSSDPEHCGTCGHACASGICAAGQCAGELPGHIVVIGHDYQRYNAAMARVLGNAVALGLRAEVVVARWAGTPAPGAVAGTTSALTSAMQQIGRPWHAVALPSSPSPQALDGVDVLIVDAQLGDGDALELTAAAWSGALAAFLDRAGVVVVLEGVGGVGHRFGRGAGLFAVSAPVAVTGASVVVVDAADALAQQVASPYAAAASSVGFPGAADPVVTTAAGQPVVLHTTR